ncbi:conserved hypothetical protein [Ricinus communis]|uniref:Uncharacterized protein n=1 Tax=Ricinus communis TaxID=3988 RepID=B9S353_RICCO|nr:conserved hypothetical protein [Ricinus communis]
MESLALIGKFCQHSKYQYGMSEGSEHKGYRANIINVLACLALDDGKPFVENLIGSRKSSVQKNMHKYSIHP